MVERFVLPSNQPESLSALVTALRQDARGQESVLVASDESRIELPDDLVAVLRDVATALSQGFAVRVAPQHTTLTTSQAADVLGISRPTLVRLLEQGEIPFDKPGLHRRVRLADVLTYQERARRARSAGLDEMVRHSEEAGVYDIDEGATTARSTPEQGHK
ncbi:helix-turn-helix domain-containing protein [Haloechinothrix sp. YIM 98757]|uniref:Helix-turn-helix domain-containing protein n=1 Tax=Haloechinothrix aidingensis TaxID=2752311 RepID=A0A838A6V7_9PSEU|nr:helix-turn-helix domain-containing protein [Haloechinothrix aidingensis]MBA0125650.1 helix-turn-helix domain-containing protein [Haloechinothrix aidingensis]